MSKPVNATATRDTTCMRCAAPIARGARCSLFRERALSYREAAHSGTLYPKRRWCVDCATTREIFEEGP